MAAIFQSGKIFRNELFQIGGYKLLRGFDEESQYLSQFAIGTVEYRYLVGQNSFFYAFVDGGWGKSKIQNTKVDYNYHWNRIGPFIRNKGRHFQYRLGGGKTE